MADPWRYAAHGVRVAVRVTPRVGRDAVDGIEELANGKSVVKVRVRVAAEGGEANRAVIGLFAELLHVPKSKVRVASGVTSRDMQIAVEGQHPTHAGPLASARPALTPCTPLGRIIQAKTVHASLEGLNAIVLGRSNLVGRPLVKQLLNENATE